MKLHGIGTDIVKISRVSNLIKKKIFIKRLFNKDEILKCKKTNNSANSYQINFSSWI